MAFVKGGWRKQGGSKYKSKAEYMRVLRKRNPEMLERARIWRRQYFKDIRLLAVKALGGKCIRCGFTDTRALQIDHINGGGNKEAEKIGRIKIYMKAIKNIDKEYQLLCANCNWIKLFENGEYERKGGEKL